MKRKILFIADDPRKHFIYDGVHIINIAAKESNVFYIIRPSIEIIKKKTMETV